MCGEGKLQLEASWGSKRQDLREVRKRQEHSEARGHGRTRDSHPGEQKEREAPHPTNSGYLTPSSDQPWEAAAMRPTLRMRKQRLSEVQTQSVR